MVVTPFKARYLSVCALIILSGVTLSGPVAVAISFVMLRGRIFGNATAWIGIM